MFRCFHMISFLSNTIQGKEKFFILFIALFLSLPVIADDKIVLLNQAELHIKNKQWEKAVTLFDQVLNDSKHDPNVYSDAILAAINYDKTAALYFMEMAQVYHINMDILFDLVHERSKVISKRSDYEAFLLLLKKEKPHLNEYVTRKLVEYYKFYKQNDQLVNLLSVLCEKEPLNNEYKELLAKTLYDTGKDEQALKMFEDILRQDSTNLDALLYLGNYYYVKGFDEMSKANAAYKSLETPSRMEYTDYKHRQNHILDDYLAKASYYLERASNINKRPALAKYLEDIRMLHYTVMNGTFMRETFKVRN